MNLPRIYQPCQLLCQQELSLTSDAAHHLVNVLRLSMGQQLIIFNGQGGEYLAEIISINKKETIVTIITYNECEPESPLKIHLAQGIARGEKMDFILQKAVELGVAAITPLFTERCNVKLPRERIEKRMQHWQRVIVSACEQSGRTRIPTLHAPLSYSSWLSTANSGLRLILHPKAHHNLRQLTCDSHTVSIVIGPEGGLTEAELCAAEQQGFQRLSLGPRVLRTETAPLAAITALQYCWGDMG